MFQRTILRGLLVLAFTVCFVAAFSHTALASSRSQTQSIQYAHPATSWVDCSNRGSHFNVNTSHGDYCIDGPGNMYPDLYDINSMWSGNTDGYVRVQYTKDSETITVPFGRDQHVTAGYVHRLVFIHINQD